MSITRLRESSSKYIRYGVWVFAAIFFIGCFTMYSGGRNGYKGAGSDTRSVLATVNDTQIPREEFDKKLQDQYKQAADMGGGSINPLQLPMIKSQILQSLITNILQLEAAKKAGVGVGFFEKRGARDKMINKEMDNARKQLCKEEKKKLSDEEIDKKLAVLNRKNPNVPKSLADFRTMLDNAITPEVAYQQLMAKKLQDQITEKVGKIDDNRLKNSYRMLQVRQIAINTGSLPEAQSKRKAEDILKQINKGEDFATLAKKYSDDIYSKEKGGDIGTLPAAYDKDLRDLKDGEVSKVLKTPQGFRIAKIESSKLQLPADFEKKKKDYRDQLKETLINEQYSDLMKEVTDSAKIKINDPELNGYWLLNQIQTKPMDREKLTNEAVKSLEKATLKASDAAPYFVLAQLYKSMGKNKEALGALNDVLDGKRMVDLPELRYMQAQLCFDTGNKAKAMANVKVAYDEAKNMSSDLGIHTQIQLLAKTLGLKDIVVAETAKIKELEKAAQQSQQSPIMINPKAAAKKPAK